MTLSTEPAISIRDLLANNWDSSNTSISSDPDIHTGWFKGAPGHGDTPQVSLIQSREDDFEGGDTGFFAQGAENLVQAFTGQVLAVCWAHHDMFDGVNPKTLTFEMSEEVRRILKANTFAITDLEWVSWVGRVKRVDVDAEPTLFRQDCEVRYFYFDR